MDESRKVQMTAAEVARFHEEGLVVPDYRIPQPLLDRMRAEVYTLIERNPVRFADAINHPHLQRDDGHRCPGLRQQLERTIQDGIVEDALVELSFVRLHCRG